MLHSLAKRIAVDQARRVAVASSGVIISASEILIIKTNVAVSIESTKPSSYRAYSITLARIVIIVYIFKSRQPAREIKTSI